MAQPIKAKEIVVNKIPVGVPLESDFRVQEKDLPPLQDGELLFESLYISPDPYQRGRIRQLKVRWSSQPIAKIVAWRHNGWFFCC